MYFMGGAVAFSYRYYYYDDSAFLGKNAGEA